MILHIYCIVMFQLVVVHRRDYAYDQINLNVDKNDRQNVYI